MPLEVVMQFIAKNPPSILILAGILGWILCGFTQIPEFCSWWTPLLLVGVALQLIWMAFRYGAFR